MASQLSPLLVVLGPTGSGKTELSLYLAEALHGEIVSCDSVQVHRGLDIGSAKVPPHQRRGVRHHLLDILPPTEELTAGEYARLARPILKEIAAGGHLPIVVGGTGFYLRALLDGLSPAPPRDDMLRHRLEAAASARPRILHRFLRRFDHLASEQIHPNDRQKLIRAVEVILLTRKRSARTEMAARAPLDGFRVFRLGLRPERVLLYRRLDERSAQLFRSGLLEEAESLLRSGVPASAKPLQSLGYKQACRFLAGETTLAEAVAECQIRTRQYAKRQTTWFRAEKDVHWLSGFGSDLSVKQEAMELATAYLRRFRNESLLLQRI